MHPMLRILQGWTLVLGYRRDSYSAIDERLRMAEQSAPACGSSGTRLWSYVTEFRKFRARCQTAAARVAGCS